MELLWHQTQAPPLQQLPLFLHRPLLLCSQSAWICFTLLLLSLYASFSLFFFPYSLSVSAPLPEEINTTLFLLFLSRKLFLIILSRLFFFPSPLKQTTGVQSWKGPVPATTQTTKLDDNPRLPQDARQVPKRPAKRRPGGDLTDLLHCGTHTNTHRTHTQAPSMEQSCL